MESKKEKRNGRRNPVLKSLGAKAPSLSPDPRHSYTYSRVYVVRWRYPPGIRGQVTNPRDSSLAKLEPGSLLLLVCAPPLVGRAVPGQAAD